MKWLTLELIKKHSRIDSNVEDDLLTLYGESAEDTVLNYIGKTPLFVAPGVKTGINIKYENRCCWLNTATHSAAPSP